jgi:hypothetical protein
MLLATEKSLFFLLSDLVLGGCENTQTSARLQTDAGHWFRCTAVISTECTTLKGSLISGKTCQRIEELMKTKL